ncbi:NifU family protein [Candidatus Odyssella acanthamoebae]|uniref:Iron transporter n=1 Tax=Candidatus Odyssella acanthamoebae TaxID=91604 RepID=A0A077AXV4_9PROT|nr:NifU family protein [Candidatus Paracaedibacter acanthamoebae]AIK96844.1 iron transporter [Candidatus Paracaedibacter acanthamoebae]
MFIQTEETPNPDSLKFIPGRMVLESGTASFNQSDDCGNSPFAKRLLSIDGITSVFFGNDFITISKKTDHDWYILKPSIIGIIMEQFVAGLPIIIDNSEVSQSTSVDEDPIVQQIKELIDTRVRPAVAQDGGDILFHSFENGVVYLKMQGACSGCPSSTATLKSGIENMLRYYVPEVEEVRAVE